ncbi:MAG: Hsp70 family protein [Deltaproteobacteria bacterium]|nr:Hsp70 family protein [Deltaproteobacteria bacterium]
MGHVIGIDLGTTNSVAATVRNFKVEVVPDPQGRRLHPSVVSFPPDGSILVGHSAKQRRIVDPLNTIYSAKRFIGQSVRSPLVQLALTGVPYQLEEGPNEQAIITVHGQRRTVPEISALVLAYLKQCSERFLGGAVDRAVITVPANFNDAQRQATKLAGEIAGLKVMRILNEPTAAALAYGFGKALDRRIAVFDFGGGTFDVTVLQVRDRIFEVLATGGDSFLGGDDLDRALLDHLLANFNETHRVDARSSPEAIARLVIAAEQIKCQLSIHELVEGEITGIQISPSRPPLSLPFRITRATFENLVSPFVERAMTVTEQVVFAASLSVDDIHDIICVGGTTRVPLVQRRLATLFKKEPIVKINPDEVIAYGAAIQAGSLTDGAVDPAKFYSLLLDVTPRALGIGVAGGYAEVIIEKNAPIPIEQTRVFTTSRDNQTEVEIQCCQGESRRFGENAPLGKLTLSGLPAARRGDVQIEVTFQIDTDGILNVRARDQATGQAQQASMTVVGAPDRPAQQTDAPPPGGAAPAPAWGSAPRSPT